jgi:PAS domain S-box-containing protein
MEKDCSENKHLPENLELFFNMVENARDGINITQNGEFKYVNKAFCDMLGYTREELCCTVATDLLATSDKERMVTQHFMRMQGIGKYGIDYTILLHKNGSEVDIEFNVTPITYQGENASFISIRDITERKRMQEKLENSEHKYRNLVENAHDGIIINQFGKFKFVNPAFCKMIEYSEEELLENDFINFLAEDDRERLTQYHKLRMEGDRHHMIYEAKGISKSGKIIHFEINTTYIEYEGHPATFIILRDHTEHKILEETLKASEKKYKRLFEAESDAIFLIDKETGRILDANPAASEIYGYSHEEFLSLKNTDISAEPEKTRESTANDHNFVPIRYHKKKDGATFAVEISAGVTELDGHQVHIITARDITERLRMQDKLTKSEAKYRTLIEKSLDGIVISQDVKIIMVNKAFAEMLGFSVQECMEKFGPHFIVPEDRERVLNHHLQRMQGDLSDKKYTLSMFHKNGERIITEFSSTAIEIDGRPASLITSRDITSRIKMQEALEKSERKFRELADLLPQTVFEFSPQGKVTYFNKAGRMAYGFDENEISFNAAEGILPQDRERVQDLLRQGIQEKKSTISTEYTARRTDGKTFPVIFYASPMFENDEYMGTRGLVIDISERKAMEEALRQSEKKYRELAEMLPQAVYEHDLEGNLTYLNQAGKLKFGIDKLEPAISVYSFVLAEDIEKMINNMRKTLAENLSSSHGNIYTAFKCNGEKFPVMIFASPMISGGEKIGIRGILIDMTEHVAMENALRQSEKKYRELAEMLPQAVYELDAQGKPTYMNKAGLKAFGLDNGQKVDNAFDLFISEDRKRMDEAIENEASRIFTDENCTYSKPSEPTEFTAQRLDGSTFPVIIYGTAIVENGVVVGSRGLIIDISERKAMEEALRKSEEHYRHVIQSLQEGLFVLQDEKFIFVNDAIVDILGYTVEEMTGKHFSAVIPPELRDEAVRRNMRRRKGDGDSWSYEFLLLHKDQQTRIPVILSTNLTELDGKAAVVGTAKDITDRIKAEEEIKAAHKRLEEINQDLELTIRERTKELTKANTQLLKLQKENLQSQFDVLKQQVNPHFLFNSLNVLTSLIRLEPELAEKFTEHLAKVYRYVLENKDNELVNLSTEISFLDAYIFLINIRFMDKVVVNIRVPDEKKNHRIIPLAMQLLIENAIKHNSMSKKSPLVIDIFIDDNNHMNVVNNLQEREAHMTSTGVGLKNIQNRYRLLNNTIPVFEKTETHFRARIPLVAE